MDQAIVKAREIMLKAFQKDPGLKITYVSNIAYLLVRYGLSSKKANAAAEELFTLILAR